MSKATSGMPARPAVAAFRVLFHEPICPDCGSFDIEAAEVATGDGWTETAHKCAACGAAWPVACVTEWSTRP